MTFTLSKGTWSDSLEVRCEWDSLRVPYEDPDIFPAYVLTSVAALAQYKDRTGSVGPVSRSHVEVLPDGTEVKLGVFLSNTKSRRGKLTADKLQALADLGPEWAA